jgi:hypothetical protein
VLCQTEGDPLHTVEVEWPSTGERWPVWAQPQDIKHILAQNISSSQEVLLVLAVQSAHSVPVPNHQEMFDNMLLPVVKEAERIPARRVRDQSHIWEQVEDPGCHHKPGYNRHLLDISVEIKLEPLLQKTVFNAPPLISRRASSIFR